MSGNSRGRPGTPGLESLRQACCRRDRLRTGSRRVSCGQPLQDSEARRPLLRAARSRGARTRPACPRMHTVIVGLAGRRTEGKDGVCSFESTATASRRTARGGRTWSTRGGCATRLHWHWMRRGQAEGRSMAEPRPPRFLHPQCAWPRDPPRCRIRSHSQGAATAEFAAATAIWTRRPPSGSDRSSERCPRRLPRPLARIRGCRLGYPQCRRHEKLAWHAGKPPHRLPVQAQPFDNRPVDLRDGAARVHAQEHVPPVEH